MKIHLHTLTFWLLTAHTVFLNAQNFDIYISDAGNFNNPPWQILKFDQNGENGEVFIDDHLDWPQDIVFLEHENIVLISNLNSGLISKFDASNGSYIGEFATGIGGPTRMEIGADSLLYVLQWNNNTRVQRYQLDGTLVDQFTQANTGTAIGMDWDVDGNFYVSSYNGKYIRKFSPEGADLGNFISTNLEGPTNIWFEENGDLLVADWTAASVKRFDNMGNFLGVFFTGVPQAEGVDFLNSGDIVIGSGAASAVKLYDTNGSYIKDIIPAGSLNLLTPNAVVFRPSLSSSTSIVYEDHTFVTPSIGQQFQLLQTGQTPVYSSIEVYNASGLLVQKINLAQVTEWSASQLADGVYYLSASLKNGKIARQKIVVAK